MLQVSEETQRDRRLELGLAEKEQKLKEKEIFHVSIDVPLALVQTAWIRVLFARVFRWCPLYSNGCWLCDCVWIHTCVLVVFVIVLLILKTYSHHQCRHWYRHWHHHRHYTHCSTQTHTHAYTYTCSIRHSFKYHTHSVFSDLLKRRWLRRKDRGTTVSRHRKQVVCLLRRDRE